MNQEQVKSTVRSLVSTFGGIVVGWVAARGWVSAETLTSLLSSETFIGLVTSGAVLIWGLFVHKESNAIAVVDAIAKQPESPVKAVVMEPTPEGKAIAESLPGKTTVVAGTATASKVADSL